MGYSIKELARLSLVAKYSPGEARDNHGRWTSSGGGLPIKIKPGEKTGSKLATTHALKMIGQARNAEPEVTAHLQGIAHAVGAKMEGLDFRLKSKESLARKIDQKMEETGMNASEVGSRITDVLRYTMVLKPKDYVAGVEKTYKALKANGYTQYDHKLKNYWANPSGSPDAPEYKGLNSVLKTPKGQAFELQFHTPDSYNVKEKLNHSLYERQRTSKNPAEVAALGRAMSNNWKGVQEPQGVEALTLHNLGVEAS